MNVFTYEKWDESACFRNVSQVELKPTDKIQDAMNSSRSTTAFEAIKGKTHILELQK